MNLQRVPAFITKIIQIHETQLVRHGMMMVGETGSGKTTSIKVLASSLSLLHEEGIIDRDGYYKKVDLLVLNPKSITAGELYGEFNQLSNEWKDGIVPKLVRDCVNALNEGSDNRKWIIFDGPVDAVWIENLNTVSYSFIDIFVHLFIRSFFMHSFILHAFVHFYAIDSLFNLYLCF